MIPQTLRASTRSRNPFGPIVLAAAALWLSAAPARAQGEVEAREKAKDVTQP